MHLDKNAATNTTPPLSGATPFVENQEIKKSGWKAITSRLPGFLNPMKFSKISDSNYKPTQIQKKIVNPNVLPKSTSVNPEISNSPQGIQLHSRETTTAAVVKETTKQTFTRASPKFERPPAIYQENQDGSFKLIGSNPRPILSQNRLKGLQPPKNSENSSKISEKKEKVGISKDGTRPDQSLTQLNTGSKLSGSELLDATLKLKKDIEAEGKMDPETTTTIHLLLEKSAEKLSEEGNIERAFQARSFAGEIQLPATHPLAGNMREKVSAEKEKQPNKEFSARLSHLDTGVVKGGTLAVSNRSIPKVPNDPSNTESVVTQLFDFKISLPSRAKLETTLEHIRGHETLFKDSLPTALKGKEFSIKEENYTYKGKDEHGRFTAEKGYVPTYVDDNQNFHEAKAYVMTFEGVGSVTVGKDSEWGCLYNNISVELDPRLGEEEKLAATHQMLSVLGLGPVLGQQRPEDNERIKVAQLFRAFYPKQAHSIERSSDFYEMPLEDLKSKMSSLVPPGTAVKAMFKKYLEDQPNLMKEDEIYPGKKVWSVMDLASQMKANGAIGLMSGVGDSGWGSHKSDEESAESIALMLTNGALSGEERLKNGLFQDGISMDKDLRLGGSGEVFTRCVTKENSPEITEYTFSGNMQVLYDLEVVNRGSYGYQDDNYGIKNQNYKENDGITEIYGERSNLPEFAGQLNENSTRNELMVKNRISPQYVRGVVVEGLRAKKVLIDVFQKHGLMTDDRKYVILKDDQGKELRYAVDSFIQINETNQFTPEMWDRSKD